MAQTAPAQRTPRCTKGRQPNEGFLPVGGWGVTGSAESIPAAPDRS